MEIAGRAGTGLATDRAQEFPLVVNLNKAIIHLIIVRSVYELYIRVHNYVPHNKLEHPKQRITNKT